MVSERSRPQVVNIEGSVGGGHPTFSYAVRTALQDLGVDVTVFKPIQDGDALTRLVWKLFRRGYEIGGKGSTYQRFYEILRNNSEKGGLLLQLARRSTIKKFANDPRFLFYDHAYSFKGRKGRKERRDILLQSDVAAEPWYADGVSMVAVPLEEAAQQLKQWGHPAERIKITGFMVPPQLLDADRSEEIRRRLRARDPMTVGFYGTGASPEKHFSFLRNVVIPGLAPLLDDKRINLIIYTWTNRVLAKKIGEQLNDLRLGVHSRDENIEALTGETKVIWGDTPQDAIHRSITEAAHIDVLWTMLGERVGWPMLKLPLSHINLNARANTAYAVEGGFAPPIDMTPSAVSFLQEELSNGGEHLIKFLDQSQALPNDGARNVAGIIYENIRG